MNAIPAPILMMENVTVDFDGFKALTNVNLSLTAGTLRILIGPNGAGKSTLCDTIIGRVRPTAGKITFKDEVITALPEQEIVRRGICRKFQTPGILPTLTVMENLLIAGRRDRSWWKSFTSKAPAGELAAAESILEKSNGWKSAWWSRPRLIFCSSTSPPPGWGRRIPSAPRS
jgi:urea transport system ATP-binding protein